MPKMILVILPCLVVRFGGLLPSTQLKIPIQDDCAPAQAAHRISGAPRNRSINHRMHDLAARTEEIAMSYSSTPILTTEVAQDHQVLVADGLLRVDEAADFLKVSRSKVYQLMDRGELRYAKIGKSRRIPHKAVV